MEINTQTVSGQLEQVNKFCIDWNHLGCVAYASSNIINIIDSYSMKLIQTLTSTRGTHVSKLKWSTLSLNESEGSNDLTVKLASSSDDSNIIVVWNTNDGRVLQELHEINNFQAAKVNEIRWDFNNGENLFVLYSNSKLVIWQADKGVRLWSKVVGEQLNHFAIDPHEQTRIAMLGSNFIQFLRVDFEKDNYHEKWQKKFYLMSSEGDQSVDSSKKSMNILTSYFKSIKGSDKSSSSNKSSSLTLNECFQIEFHSHIRNIVFLAYPKEVFIFDLVIHQTIGFVQLDKTSSPFVQIYSCSQSDALYSLHENGLVTFHVRNQSTGQIDMPKAKEPIGEQLFNSLDRNYVYYVHAQSDQIRLSKSSQVFGFSVCPITQRYFCVLLSDGRLLRYELIKKRKPPRRGEAIDNESEPVFLFDLLPCLSRELKVTLTGLINAMPPMPYIIKMCPPLTKKNSKYWQPLLAIGCPNGFLYIYNLNQNRLIRKIQMYTNMILGIEWCSTYMVVTWSNNGLITGGGSSSSGGVTGSTSAVDLASLSSSQNSGGKQVLVKNEVSLTDLRTGESIQFRQGVSEESPITSIKLSNLRQYLVILFKDQPLEIWDMRSFSMIKKISKKSPNINVLEWCPYDFYANFNKSKKVELKNEVLDLTKSIADGLEIQSKPESTGGIKSSVSAYSISDNHGSHHSSDAKESFICIDQNGLMYSFSVESNHIKDASVPLPEDGLISSVTCMCLKKDYIMYGDQEGNVIRWNYMNKLSKQAKKTTNGEVRKIKFAPGKENMLLLVQYADSIDIMDSANLEIVSTYKHSNSRVKLLDSYWSSSDRVLVLFTDGQIRLFDFNLRQTPTIYHNSLPSLFVNRVIFRKNVVLAFRNILFECIDKDSNELSKESLLDYSKRYFKEQAQVQTILTESVQSISSNMINLLSHVNKVRSNKLVGYAFVSSYFSMNTFEAKFWSLLVYIFNESSMANTGHFDFVTKQNTFLANPFEFRLGEYETLKLFKDKHELKDKLIHLVKDLLFFNELDLAFNILMETDPASEDYTNNLLKAGLISSLKSHKDNSDVKTSIKLVATNLIANGKLHDGIELLCLIGLVYDACRYLQDNNEWERAAWLAKIRLNDEEYIEVVKRWSEHLCSSQANKKEQAILLLISCKQYWKAFEILSETSYTELAFLFLKYLLENDLLSGVESIDDEFRKAASQSSSYFDYIHQNCDKLASLPIRKVCQSYLRVKRHLNFD